MISIIFEGPYRALMRGVSRIVNKSDFGGRFTDLAPRIRKLSSDASDSDIIKNIAKDHVEGITKLTGAGLAAEEGINRIRGKHGIITKQGSKLINKITK